MAITWDFTLTPVVVGQTCDAVALRTDDTPGSKQYTVTSKSVDTTTAQKKIEALNALWAKYERQVVDQATMEAYEAELLTLAASAKVNFEGREP